jgi:hypothetical protein
LSRKWFTRRSSLRDTVGDPLKGHVGPKNIRGCFLFIYILYH